MPEGGPVRVGVLRHQPRHAGRGDGGEQGVHKGGAFARAGGYGQQQQAGARGDDGQKSQHQQAHGGHSNFSHKTPKGKVQSTEYSNYYNTFRKYCKQKGEGEGKIAICPKLLLQIAQNRPAGARRRTCRQPAPYNG